MQSHLKTIRTESTGKSASKVSTATDELQFLLDFNSSVCHAMARAMEHLTDFVFVNVANTTLLRRDSYLSYLKAGVKADTLNALRAAPLDLDTLFPDKIVKQAEEDIAAFDRNRSGSVYKKGRYHPYERQDKKSGQWQTGPTGLEEHFFSWSTPQREKEGTSTPPDRPRASSLINDNHCVTLLQARLLAGSSAQTIDNLLNVKPLVVTSVHTAPGPSQRKEISPGAAVCYQKDCTLKSVKNVSCVIPLSCAQPVTSFKNVASNLPVGTRLQNFWQTWLDLGAGPKIVQILREGYTLPFRIRPNLTRSPTVVSPYVNPHRNSYLLEALHQLIDKNAVELVHNQTIDRF